MFKILRQMLGIEQIRQCQQRQMEMLFAQGNLLKYSLTDLEKVKATTTYQRCFEIVSLLSPMDIKGGKYVRIGKKHDGGYVMLDGFQKKKIDAAYSFGIYKDVSWDEAIANDGIDVFMYDPTIFRLPKHHPNFHFFKIGLTGHEKRVNFKTLEGLIAENNHRMCKNMIMKMDVEGSEWDIFSETSSEVISQFSQIVVEFHDLFSEVNSQKYLSMVNVFKKINQTHQSIHVHANNFALPLWIGGLVLPAAIEVTFIRRTDVADQLIANTRQFPTEIDQPNNADWPDVDLGRFAVDESI